MFFETIVTNALCKMKDEINDTILTLREEESALLETICTNTEFFINDFGHIGYRAWVHTKNDCYVDVERTLEFALYKNGRNNVKVMLER